jgi:hypothetical protein
VQHCVSPLEKPGSPSLQDLEATVAYQQLAGWMFSPDTLNLPLHEVEVEQARRAREVNRLLLESHIRARGTGDIGPAIAISHKTGDAVAHTHRRQQLCHLTTQFGDIAIDRTAYHARGRESFRPLDSALSLPESSFSYPVQRVVVRLSTQGPFDEARGNVEDFYGTTISKCSVESLARDAAVDFDIFYEQRTIPPPEKTASILVGCVDGKGVPMVKEEKAQPVVRLKRGEKANKKRMATVATAYTIAPRVRTPEEVVESLFQPELKARSDETPAPPRDKPEHKRVWASLHKSKEEVIAALKDEMNVRDPSRQKKQVVVTDGERALQYRVAKFFPAATVILDLLHVLERIWTIAHIFHGEGTPEAQEWVRDHVLRLLRGEVSQVIKGTRQSATKRGIIGQKRELIDKSCDYLCANRERMHYDQYLAEGLPIASGAVEGACKNLVKDRMERSGMRWKVPTAEAILKLRALNLSGDFEEYWQYHIAQEQRRLYACQTWEPIDESLL